MLGSSGAPPADAGRARALRPSRPRGEVQLLLDGASESQGGEPRVRAVHDSGGSRERLVGRSRAAFHSQFSKVRSGKVGPDPERFELLKGILEVHMSKWLWDLGPSLRTSASGTHES